MMASAFEVAPKLSPPAGIPPMPPASTVRVTRCRMPSSLATEAMPSGIPIPRLTTELGLRNIAALRAMTLRGVRVMEGIDSSAMVVSARVGRVEGLGERLLVVFRWAQHHGVDQDPRDLHLAGADDAARRGAFHLDDDQAAGVLDRLGDGQGIEGDGLAFHGDVALGVRGGSAEQCDVDAPTGHKKVLCTIDLDQFDDVLDAAAVQSAAFHSGVDERADADVGQGARATGGDVPEPVTDDALREAVGVDVTFQCECTQCGSEAPVPTDRTFHHACMPEVVEALRLSVALAGGEDQGESAGFAGFQESPLQGDGHVFGKSDSDESAGGRWCHRTG